MCFTIGRLAELFGFKLVRVKKANVQLKDPVRCPEEELNKYGGAALKKFLTQCLGFPDNDPFVTRMANTMGRSSLTPRSILTMDIRNMRYNCRGFGEVMEKRLTEAVKRYKRRFTI